MRTLPLLLATPILLLAAARPLPAQPNPSRAEREIVRAVDAQTNRSIALIERVVNINSGTMNFAGVRRVADVLRPQFDSLGFTTRWVDGTPFNRAGHLVAEHRGPGPKIVLIGHLDTVFEPSSPFQRFERLTDSTARGPGIIDMKGGDVIAIAALRALKVANQLDGMHVVVVLHGDEESAGAPLDLARATLRDAARGAAYAIGLEDGDGDPRTAVIARRSAGGWTLRVKGTPAHSSQVFTDGVGSGAVYEAARILTAFHARLSGEQYLTFNPGLIAGGTLVTVDSTGTVASVQGKSNVVAEHATVSGDLRGLTPEQLARARAAMREMVSAHLPRTSAEIEFHDGYPPMAPTDGNRRLLAILDQVSRDVGSGPVGAVDPARAGAADVSFVADLVPMVIDGIGLSGWDGHTVNETADLRQLPAQTRRVAVLLHRLSRQR
ncbi:MAG: M20/M25/M40 family metallo-hydrolase [Gemmatimonadaceae bacterium]